MTIGRRTVISGALVAALGAKVGMARMPPPTAVRRLSPGLDRVIAPDATIETIATGIQWAEGPLWLPDQNALLFTDPPANIIRRWQAGKGVAPFLNPSGAADTDPALVREPGANGLALGVDGALRLADSGSRALVRVDLASKQRTTLVDRYRGKRFNSPNDLAIARAGTIYFTDPPYGLAQGDTSSLKELDHNGVYRWAPGGEAVLLDGTLTRPNGIALSPDERTLYVTVSDKEVAGVYAYPLDARGDVGTRRLLLDARPMLADDAPGMTDGMKVAADGTLFCSAPGGVLVMTPEGEMLGLISGGRAIANCCFGEDGRTLFMAATDRVLRVALRLNGWRA
ncbi:SMP-30/gluconolactonase/LRE family protein [Hephaestia sp. GCM10023244]|uniref:SMP-30/gluconolactonase/LRE family protein n=1 Tax=unclassified Hephaestia TaxID=2631281 RepID=UPI0020771018|nr:SMP-30/gluconolactonase/LRE family protein [Hephaestia sp. MAHUQ-44]MCM8732008.1 SMP-30/gluconolactonase/LRE family protein [Hephaestia sp. MAHUQ-44]